jgi:hypothetical protein
MHLFIACYRLVCPTGVADRVNLGKLILERFSCSLSQMGQVKFLFITSTTMILAAVFYKFIELAGMPFLSKIKFFFVLFLLN